LGINLFLACDCRDITGTVKEKKVEITPHLHIPILDKKKSIFNPELSRLSDFDP